MDRGSGIRKVVVTVVWEVLFVLYRVLFRGLLFHGLLFHDLPFLLDPGDHCLWFVPPYLECCCIEPANHSPTFQK